MTDRRTKPTHCRAVVLIDGQNLYRASERAFGLRHPSFDPLKLGPFVCRGQSWDLAGIRLYTGVPPAERSPFWHSFWTRKTTQLRRRGVICNTRPTFYRPHTIKLPDGTKHHESIAEEKGIDVWLAVELISLAHRDEYDIAVIFSQDQDLCPAVDEVKRIAGAQGRWIKVVSAYPDSERALFRMGIRGTDYMPIGEVDFRSCLDDYDYVSRAAEDAERPGRRR